MTPAYPARKRPIPAAALARAAALVAMMTALSGCYTTREKVASAPPPPPPNEYNLRHPISIQEKDRTVTLFVGSKRGGLTPSQRADVIAFSQAWKRDATGGVVIEIPAGTPNERAAADSVQEIQAILAGAGVPAGGVLVRPYTPEPGKLAVMRLNYPKMTAEAGPCGVWPEDLGPSLKGSYLENRPYYNFGCASQRNLAAMVENPGDLVQPRGETPAYTGRRTIVLDKYRKGEATATINPDANKAKISDVGK